MWTTLCSAVAPEARFAVVTSGERGGGAGHAHRGEERVITCAPTACLHPPPPPPPPPSRPLSRRRRTGAEETRMFARRRRTEEEEEEGGARTQREITSRD
eukprot:3933405-Rhodomonas_salina.1